MLTLTDRSQAQKDKTFDDQISGNAQQMLRQGKQIFASIPLAMKYSGEIRSSFTRQLQAPSLAVWALA